MISDTTTPSLIERLLNFGPIGCLFLLISLILGICVTIILWKRSLEVQRVQARFALAMVALFTASIAAITSSLNHLDIVSLSGHSGDVDPRFITNELHIHSQSLVLVYVLAAFWLLMLGIELVIRRKS